jgi:CheY-like chemotaxis protein
MNGDIAVQSALGEGAEFTLRLPCPLSTAAVAPREADDAKDASPVTGDLSRVRIVVVEDEENNQIVIQELLASLEAAVRVFDSGDAFLTHLGDVGSDALDLVLMDLKMPKMDGYEATRRALEVAPELPVVALTAHALAATRRRCLEVGMVDYVTKPVNLQKLEAVIRQHARPFQNTQ